MVKNHINSAVNLALYPRRDLKFTCVSGCHKDCGLGVIEQQGGGLFGIRWKVVTPHALGCGSHTPHPFPTGGAGRRRLQCVLFSLV